MEETCQVTNGGKGEETETRVRFLPGTVRAVLRENGFFYAAGLLALGTLKWYGHGAGAEDLEWMLRPLADLVEWTGGIPFEREPGTGFVSLARGIVIAPSCAGLNFLIISFGSLFFSFVHRIGGMPRKFLWFALAGGFAFVLTLAVNTVRILLSVELYGWDIYGVFVTPGRVHRFTGIVIYLSALLAACGAAGFISRRPFFSGRPPEAGGDSVTPGFSASAAKVLFPLLWYLAVTVGIPLAGLTAARQAACFREHIATVVIACLAILLLAVFLGGGQKGRTRKKFLKSPFCGRLCKKRQKQGVRIPRNEAYLPVRHSDGG